MKNYIIIGIISIIIACGVFYIGRINGLSECQKASKEAIKTISEVKTIYIKNTLNVTPTEKRSKLLELLK